jgi:hypothetical protein
VQRDSENVKLFQRCELMFGDIPMRLGCIQNRRPYGGMPLECIQVDLELILCQDPINVKHSFGGE